MTESYLVQELGPLPKGQPKLAEHVLDLFSLKGKVASITGASVGIGAAIAEAYAQAGADIAIWYNSHPADDKAEELASKYGVKAKAYKCSINDPVQVEATIKQIEADFSKIDIFVANAGVTWSSASILDIEGHSEWNRIIDMDLNGVYYCAKYVGRIFREQAFGSFITTASISAHIVNVPQLQAPYNAAKAGVITLMKSLALEWAGFARVNTISPGYIITDMTDFATVEMRAKWQSLIPMGREATPKELVGAYLYLASDASTYTTGSDIVIDGGYTLA